MMVLVVFFAFHQNKPGKVMILERPNGYLFLRKLKEIEICIYFSFN